MILKNFVKNFIFFIMFTIGFLLANIPEDFDYQQYIDNYEDLSLVAHDNKEERKRFAHQHYLDHGKREGRSYRKMGNIDQTFYNSYQKKISPRKERDSFIKQFMGSQKEKDGLEIEPYFRPILTGERVKYFDVLDREGLLKKAENDSSVNPENIPEKIHYVHESGDMSVIKDKFDFVFSSHNIEHQVDLIRHLNQVYDLLKEGGHFFIIIPDKRYCFDHYITESRLSDVLSIHWQNQSVHDLKTILAMRCETTHNDSPKHWEVKNGELHFSKDKKCYQNAYEEFKKAKGGYIDSNMWRFTPQSFYYIVEHLKEMGEIKFEIEIVYDMPINSNEFCAVLKKP